MPRPSNWMSIPVTGSAEVVTEAGAGTGQPAARGSGVPGAVPSSAASTRPLAAAWA